MKRKCGGADADENLTGWSSDQYKVMLPDERGDI